MHFLFTGSMFVSCKTVCDLLILSPNVVEIKRYEFEGSFFAN